MNFDLMHTSYIHSTIFKSSIVKKNSLYIIIYMYIKINAVVYLNKGCERKDRKIVILKVDIRLFITVLIMLSFGVSILHSLVFHFNLWFISYLLCWSFLASFQLPFLLLHITHSFFRVS